MAEIPIPTLRLIYRRMVLTRAFDTKLNELAAAGEPLVHHSGLGQEATPVTACAVLRSDDYLMPYHRGWAWAIGKGMEPKRILSELIGKKTGYMGPCPPSGTHRYSFKVYALDEKLNLPAGETKDRLLEAIEGHILGQGRLMGRYKRQ